jgi:hypothetical protein
MQTFTRVVLMLSIAVNGVLAGLIVGHVASRPSGCSCDDCQCCTHKEARDEGPFPTGWVTPDRPGRPPKPSGAAP